MLWLFPSTPDFNMPLFANLIITLVNSQIFVPPASPAFLFFPLHCLKASCETYEFTILLLNNSGPYYFLLSASWLSQFNSLDVWNPGPKFFSTRQLWLNDNRSPCYHYNKLHVITINLIPNNKLSFSYHDFCIWCQHFFHLRQQSTYVRFCFT